MAVRISYKPAAARILSAAPRKKKKHVRGPGSVFFSLGAAERIPHSHAEEKKKTRPGARRRIFFPRRG